MRPAKGPSDGLADLWKIENQPLRQVDLFDGLTERERSLVRERARQRRYRKHAIIFNQGDEAGDAWLVEDGWVRTYYTALSGKEITIGLWSRGDIIGAPDICATSRLLSAQAVEDSVVLRFSPADLDFLITEISRFARNLIMALSFKVRWVTTIVDRLSTEPVISRLAQMLVTLAQLRGVQREEGILIIERLTHQDISRMVGASRQWVTRSLSQFEREGLLQCSKRRIIIIDVARLVARTYVARTYEDERSESGRMLSVTRLTT